MADGAGITTPKLGRAPRVYEMRSLYVEPCSVWTPATIRAALDEHEQGRFYTSAVLADAALRDAKILRGIKRRTAKLASRSALPFKVEPGEGDGRRLEAVRKRTERLWWTVTPESVLGAILRDAIMLGVALGRIEWTRTSTEWVPRLCHVPAHGLTWQPWDRRWTYQTDDGKTLDVTPGDGEWFLYLPHGSRSWMLGAIRAVGLKWLMREDGWLHWARSDERHSSPTLAISEPQFAADDVEGPAGSQGTQASAFYRSMRIGPNVVLRLPKNDEGEGWDAKWLELAGKPWEGTRTFLQDLGAEFDAALLGVDSDAGAKGGDGELASERVAVEDLASDAETLSTALREQVWKPDVAYNVSPTDLDLAAWGRWDTRPPPDLMVRAETLDKAGDAIGKLLPLGVDCAPVVAELKLEAPKGLEVPVPAPIAPPPEGGADKTDRPTKTVRVLLTNKADE